MALVIVFLGGGAGSVSRYFLSVYISTLWNGNFPPGTVFINLVGCFLIGFLGGFSEKLGIDPNLRLLLQTGFLGGFTTFSSFGLETFQLVRKGELVLASTNLLVSNLVGVLLVFGGFYLAKLLLSRV